MGKTPRKGTVRLFYLIDEMLDRKKRQELLEYIGELEKNESHLLERFRQFSQSIGFPVIIPSDYE